MGMYDYVHVGYPLPVGVPVDFQTKDFDCELENYTITAEGRLIREAIEWESTPKDELPYPDFPACGSLRPKTKTLVDTEFHGDMRFYTSSGKREDNTYHWWEFVARFTEGRLVYIKPVEQKAGAQ